MEEKLPNVPSDPPAYQPYQPPPAPNHSIPMNQPQQSTVLVAPAAFVMNTGPMVGPDPQTMTCPNCRLSITTVTKSSVSASAWLIGLMLCIIGCPCFSCIPCCLSSMRDTTHMCPSCNCLIGRYRAG